MLLHAIDLRRIRELPPVVAAPGSLSRPGIALDSLFRNRGSPVKRDAGLFPDFRSLPHGRVGEIPERVIGMVGNTLRSFLGEFLLASQWVPRFRVSLELNLLDKVCAAGGDKEPWTTLSTCYRIPQGRLKMEELLQVGDGGGFVVIGPGQVKPALPVFLGYGSGSCPAIPGGFEEN